MEQKLFEKFPADRTLKIYRKMADDRGVDWSVDPMKIDP
jgi:hypothetical protein